MLGISERRYREWEKLEEIPDRNSIASATLIENYKDAPTISTPCGGTNVAQSGGATTNTTNNYYSGREEKQTPDNTAGVFIEPYLQENLLRIPYIEDLTACASFVENLYGYNHEVNYYPIYAEQGEEIAPTTHMVFQVHGESMEPTIPNGAKVLVEVVPRGKWEQAKGIVLVAYNDTLTIKRVKKNNIYDKNTITLIADNEAYGEEEIQLYDIRAIWSAKRIISAKL